MQLPFRSAAPPQPAPGECVRCTRNKRHLPLHIHFKLSCGVFIHLYPTRSSFFKRKIVIKTACPYTGSPDKGFGRYFPSVFELYTVFIELAYRAVQQNINLQSVCKILHGLVDILSFRLLSIFGKASISLSQLLLFLYCIPAQRFDPVSDFADGFNTGKASASTTKVRRVFLVSGSVVREALSKQSFICSLIATAS